MIGLTTFNLSASSIIGIFITLGIIVVLISIVPTLGVAPAIKWFMSSIIFISIFYSVTVNLLTYNLTIGIGLATNIISMFSGDPNSLSFLPWIFFTSLGLFGVICGMFSISSGGGD
jgi:hypothetical protein